MERFSYLPSNNDEFFICMICLTKHDARKNNFIFEKKKNPELVLYDAITPEVIDFNKQCSKLNFHHHLNLQKGRKALWLSNLELFEYFLKSNHKYLVAVQDDATLPENLKDILKEKYVNHPDFLGLGGTRLGQFASCNLYNKHCIKNILNSIKEYPIDRGLDHYVSNIPDPWTKEERPFNLYTSLPGLPRLLTSVNGSISKKSMRIYYDKKKL
tara:strand:+ start:18761 stop:19399 length:639 start_codon:yes stop_codon:yes gene_type:complete